MGLLRYVREQIGEVYMGNGLESWFLSPQRASRVRYEDG
jgi:hypothetical protein